MSRPAFDVFITLEKVICYDEGDGIGSAEPYLWNAFFRIGGDDVTIVYDGLTYSDGKIVPLIHLEGAPYMEFSTGSHGDLGSTDVNAGDTLNIPAINGRFNTLLKPIPVPQELKDLGQMNNIPVPDDFPGFVGAIAVLMEQDNVTDAGAEAGHQALNTAVQAAIQNVIDTRNYDNSDVGQAEIDSLTNGIDDKVSNAIQEEQGFFANIWSWLNADDQIGHQVFLYCTDDMTENSAIELEKRWKNEGDWEITGNLLPLAACPADAMAGVLNMLSGADHPLRYERAALQQFRDTEFLRNRGLQPWWELVRQNKGSLAAVVLRDRHARDLAFDLFNRAQTLVKEPDKPVADADITRALEFFEVLRASPDRSARIAASRAAHVLERCRGKSVRQAMDIFSAAPPVRKQRKTARADAIV